MICIYLHKNGGFLSRLCAMELGNILKRLTANLAVMLTLFSIKFVSLAGKISAEKLLGLEI